MEVSLHRTKGLLGEKVIHLRHLEQSLERVAKGKRSDKDVAMRSDEQTLSDMSSASSGFSSTDLGTDTFIGIYKARLISCHLFFSFDVTRPLDSSYVIFPDKFFFLFFF